MRIFHIGLSAGSNDGLCRALQAAGEYKEVNTNHQTLNQAVLEITREWIPDLIFMQIQHPGLVSIETLIELKQKGCKVFNWTGDVRVPIPEWYIDTGKHITCSLFTNMNDVETLQKLGIPAAYLPIGYDETIYKPDFNIPHNSYRAVFLGNNYNDLFTLSEMRKVLTRELKSRYGNMFGLFGSGWSECSGNFMGDQQGEANLYRSVPMAINLSHYDLIRYSSDRILRIMGSGCLCLTKWYPDIERDYIDGMHLRVWETIDQLFELIDYYNKSENAHERKAIAVLGQKHTERNFTWKLMLEKLIKIYCL